MLKKYTMFRLHIVCCDVEFCGWESSLPVAKNLPQGKEIMKKILLLGLLLSLSTGCGRGWLPCLSRGAPCGNGGCMGAAPALPHGCTTCVGGNAAGYGGYGDEIVGDSYYGGNSYAAGETYVGEGVAPSLGGSIPMAPLTNPTPRLPAP